MNRRGGKPMEGHPTQGRRAASRATKLRRRKQRMNALLLVCAIVAVLFLVFILPVWLGMPSPFSELKRAVRTIGTESNEVEGEGTLTGDYDGLVISEIMASNQAAVTDENGRAQTGDTLEKDKAYWIKELEAPEGYNINEDIFPVSSEEIASGTQELIVPDTPKTDPANITIEKRSKQQPGRLLRVYLIYNNMLTKPNSTGATPSPIPLVDSLPSGIIIICRCPVLLNARVGFMKYLLPLTLCLHIGLSLSFHILIILKELGTFHKHRIVVLKRVF